jgi:hypothetical protein
VTDKETAAVRDLFHHYIESSVVGKRCGTRLRVLIDFEK